MRASSWAIPVGERYEIDAAGGDGAPGHAALLGGFVLGERDSPLGLDRLETQRAVGARARKDDADGVMVLVLGERSQERVDGSMLPPHFRSRHQFEMAVRHQHGSVRWDHVDPIGLNQRLIVDLGDRHCRVSTEDLGEHALMFGGEVLHEHKRHASIGRERLEELPIASRPPAEAPIPTIGNDGTSAQASPSARFGSI